MTTEINEPTPQKYPLAFDVNGDPLEVPPEAVAWRVRRGGGRRGRPRAVFDQDTGRQMEIPLHSTIDELVERGCPPDRYRLEAVDAEGRILPEIVAVIELAGDEEEVPAPVEKPAEATTETLREMRQLVSQLVEANCRTMQAMATAFGPVHPVQQPQVVVEQPAPAAGGIGGLGIAPDQLMQYVAMLGKVVADTLKSAGIGGGAAAAGSAS